MCCDRREGGGRGCGVLVDVVARPGAGVVVKDANSVSQPSNRISFKIQYTIARGIDWPCGERDTVIGCIRIIYRYQKEGKGVRWGNRVRIAYLTWPFLLSR